MPFIDTISHCSHSIHPTDCGLSDCRSIFCFCELNSRCKAAVDSIHEYREHFEALMLIAPVYHRHRHRHHHRGPGDPPEWSLAKAAALFAQLRAGSIHYQVCEGLSIAYSWSLTRRTTYTYFQRALCTISRAPRNGVKFPLHTKIVLLPSNPLSLQAVRGLYAFILPPQTQFTIQGDHSQALCVASGAF